MIRVNLLPLVFDGEHRALGRLGVRPLRSVLAAGGLIAAIGGGGTAIAIHREGQLDLALRAALSTLAAHAGERERAHVQALDIARYEALASRIEKARRSGPAAANRIAQIGNAIPASAWLTSMNPVASGFDILGKARSIDTLAAALGRLDKLPGIRTVNLMTTGSNGFGLDFSLHLDATATP